LVAGGKQLPTLEIDAASAQPDSVLGKLEEVSTPSSFIDAASGVDLIRQGDPWRPRSSTTSRVTGLLAIA
jgi:hypothetical protein